MRLCHLADPAVCIIHNLQVYQLFSLFPFTSYRWQVGALVCLPLLFYYLSVLTFLQLFIVYINWMVGWMLLCGLRLLL